MHVFLLFYVPHHPGFGFINSSPDPFLDINGLTESLESTVLATDQIIPEHKVLVLFTFTLWLYFSWTFFLFKCILRLWLIFNQPQFPLQSDHEGDETIVEEDKTHVDDSMLINETVHEKTIEVKENEANEERVSSDETEETPAAPLASLEPDPAPLASLESTTSSELPSMWKLKVCAMMRHWFYAFL